MGSSGSNRPLRIRTGVGGAAQAAADLAAAGGGPDPAKLEAATDILRVGDKIMRGQRMFGRTHPSFEVWLTELHDKARRYCEAHGELGLVLEPDGATLEGGRVYHADRIEDSYLFVLYQDGVRQLSLLPGLGREEIRKLFQVLEQTSTVKDDEDDAVTRLWSAALEHVGYVVVETFSERDEDERDSSKSAEEVKQIVNLAMIKEIARTQGSAGQDSREAKAREVSIRLSAADVTFLRSANLAALDELPAAPRDAELGEMYRLTARDLGELAAKARQNPTVEQCVEALSEGLAAGGDAADLGPVASFVGYVVEAMVGEGWYARAAEVCAGMSRRCGADARVAPLLAEALAGDKLCDGVVRAVGQGAEGGTFDLLVSLPAQAARRLLAGLPSIADRKRRRAMCDALAGARLEMPATGVRRREALLAAATALLEGAGEDDALELLHLALTVGRGAVQDLLVRAMASKWPRVRFEALRGLVATGEPATAVARARLALSDRDPAVRRVAVEHLAAAGPPQAAAWLEALAAAPDFAAREAGEKKRIFLAIATLRGVKAAAFFRERLGRRNLFGKTDVDEERAAAAAALGLLHDEESRALLRKLAGATLTRALVKQECAAALRLLDTPLARGSAHMAPVTHLPEDSPAKPGSVDVDSVLREYMFEHDTDGKKNE